MVKSTGLQPWLCHLPLVTVAPLLNLLALPPGRGRTVLPCSRGCAGQMRACLEQPGAAPGTVRAQCVLGFLLAKLFFPHKAATLSPA